MPLLRYVNIRQQTTHNFRLSTAMLCEKEIKVDT